MLVKIFSVLMIVSFASCNDTLSENSSTRSSPLLSSDLEAGEGEQEVVFEQDSGSAQADYPVVVTGAYLTCSWFKDISEGQMKLGCNVLDSDGKVIVAPSEQYSFALFNNTSALNVSDITYTDSKWKVVVKTGNRVDVTLKNMKMRATPNAQYRGESLSTAIPPCDFCEVNKKVFKLNAYLFDVDKADDLNVTYHSEILNIVRFVERHHTESKGFSNDFQLIANILQATADASQLTADMFPNNNTLQNIANFDQNIANLEQNKVDSIDEWVERINLEINKEKIVVDLATDALNESREKREQVENFFVDLKQIYLTMECQNTINNMDDYLKCANNSEYQGKIDRFNSLYEELIVQLGSNPEDLFSDQLLQSIVSHQSASRMLSEAMSEFCLPANIISDQSDKNEDCKLTINEWDINYDGVLGDMAAFAKERKIWSLASEFN